MILHEHSSPHSRFYFVWKLIPNKSFLSALRPIADSVRIERPGPQRGSRSFIGEEYVTWRNGYNNYFGSGSIMEGRVKKEKGSPAAPFRGRNQQGLWMNVANRFLRAVARALQWSALFLMRPPSTIHGAISRASYFIGAKLAFFCAVVR